MPQALAGTTSKGVTLSFNAVNVTVSVHSAIAEDSSRKLKSLCLGGHDGQEAHGPSPIRQRRSCPVCDHDVAADFEKGQEVADGYVIIPQDVIDLEKASALEHKSMQITAHPADEVISSMLPSGKSYYLSLPQESMGQRQAYTLISQIISARPDLAFMTLFTLRTAVSVFQLTVAGPGTLVLRQMADAELVRMQPEIPFVELGDATLAMGQALTDMIIEPFRADVHGSGKINAIASYAATQTPVASVDGIQESLVAASSGVDIMEMLANTLEANGVSIPAQAPAGKAPAKRAVAAVRPVKAVPAKKVPAKKAPAKVAATRTRKAS